MTKIEMDCNLKTCPIFSSSSRVFWKNRRKKLGMGGLTNKIGSSVRISCGLNMYLLKVIMIDNFLKLIILFLELFIQKRFWKNLKAKCFIFVMVEVLVTNYNLINLFV